MPNGVMSFPSNHKFNVKTQTVRVIKKAKSLHQNKKILGKTFMLTLEPFQRRTISKLYVLHVLHKTHCI